MRASIVALFALFALPTTAAQPAADLPISLATAKHHHCDEPCHAQLSAVMDANHKKYIGHDFDWDFYATASNFSTATPGDLLKLKAVDPTTLDVKSGVTGYRFQYVTEDLDGTFVPATGFIALPFSLPASGTFPLVAYAHGTIGAWFGCAPSNGPDFYDSDTWQLLTMAGYAVVATDYAGLGNNAVEHKYLAFSVNAMDVFHALTAARQAFGAILSRHWMSVGHSQGGAVVWRLAEDLTSLAARHDRDEADNYLGAVALGPSVRPFRLLKAGGEIMKSVDDFHTYGIPGYFGILAITMKRVYPDFNATMLGDGLRARLPLIIEGQLCLFPCTVLTADLSADQITSLAGNGPGLSQRDIEIFEDWEKRFDPGNGATKTLGPVLVIQGTNDTAVTASVVEEAYEEACATGSEVHLTIYPKQDHVGMIMAAAPDWVRWVHGRFAAAEAGTLDMTVLNPCTKVVKTPIDYENVKAQRMIPSPKKNQQQPPPQRSCEVTADSANPGLDVQCIA